MSRCALPLLVLASLVALGAIVNETAGKGLVEDRQDRQDRRNRDRDPEVHVFGAKGPRDVELFTKVIKRRQRPTKGRLDTVRYPPTGGISKNVVTHVAVAVPRRTLTKDEVRITDGGPGMGFVVLTIGGRRSFLVDYNVTVYGREQGAAAGASNKPATAAAADAADGFTEAAAAAQGSSGPEEQEQGQGDSS